jgi:predicted permease
VTDDPLWQRYWRFLSARFRGEVQDEVEFHLMLRARELEAQGYSAADARREALRRFGDPATVRQRLERIERQRGFRLRWAFGLDELKQDVRYGIRALIRRPSFTLMTAASLALGIAAVTVVLSIVDSWLLRPLPVKQPSELVVIGAANRAMGSMTSTLISLPTFRDLAARTDLFQSAAAAQMALAAVRLPNADQGQRWMLQAATGSYFSVLGIDPSVGRFFTEDDDLRRDRLLVLTYRSWQTAFGGDPRAIGSTVYLNTVPFVVLGVAPPEFHGTEHLIQVFGFVPVGTLPALDPAATAREVRRDRGSFKVIARRQPHESIGSIRTGLSVLTNQLQAAYPELGAEYRLVALPESVARPTLEASGGIVTGAVIFLGLALLVLVTAAVNATNLLLARGSAREPELALRQALGASRARVVRQLLTETMLLAALALGAGWLLARLGVGAILSVPVTTMDLSLSWGVAVDWRVFGLTVLLTVAVGLLAGVGPAVAASRFNLQPGLKDGARAGGSRRRHRIRAALVVVQVAGSMVVLVCAGLFGASVRQAGRTDLGFQPDHTLTFGLDAALAHYSEPQARAAFDRVERAARQLPGVRASAWANSVAMASGRPVGEMVEVQVESEASTVSIFASSVSPPFFDVVRMPVLEGRTFAASDDSIGRRVAIVNREAVDRFWAGKSPIGRVIRLGRRGPPVEIVGVVKTSRYLILGEAPRPYLYFPLAQRYAPTAFLYLRTDVDPSAIAARIPATVGSVDRDLVPFGVFSLEDVLEHSVTGMLLPRLGSSLASAIGALALILTTVGLYGVIAYSVVQRTREIGVRMALGASRWTVVRGIVAQGGRLAALGIAIGVGLALMVTRALAGLVVGVSVTDLTIFVSVAAGLALVTLMSAYLPARRAARIDPVGALRN